MNIRLVKVIIGQLTEFDELCLNKYDLYVKVVFFKSQFCPE